MKKPYCFTWAFVPGDKDCDPCYQLFVQTVSGKMSNTGMVIQDASAYSKDPEPFIIYKPVKKVLIGDPPVAAVEKAPDIFQATTVAILIATGRIK